MEDESILDLPLLEYLVFGDGACYLSVSIRMISGFLLKCSPIDLPKLKYWRIFQNAITLIRNINFIGNCKDCFLSVDVNDDCTILVSPPYPLHQETLKERMWDCA